MDARSDTKNGEAKIDVKQTVSDAVAEGEKKQKRKRKKTGESKKSGERSKHADRFEMKPEGLYSDDGTLISARFEVLGRGRDPTGSGWSIFLRWKDPDQREHTWAVPEDRLHGDAGALCGDLAGLGLRIATAPSKRAQFVAYLNYADTNRRVTVVKGTGWCTLPSGKKVYVLPDRAIGDAGGETVVFEGAQNPPYASAGTLDEWRKEVGARAAGHARVMFCISVAFAAPLAEIVGAENGGFNLYGASSTGKTTAADAAASTFGRGDERGGFVRSWRHTANGLEGAAVLHNDVPLVLDEIGIADPREIGSVIYALCGGTGKGRSARDGSLRASRTWRSLILSTGEMRVVDKILEGGRRARAGQEVRVVDISAEAGQGFGVFDTAGPENDARKLADAIKAAARTYYGTAGPAFVEALLAAPPDAVVSAVKKIMARFRNRLVPAGADGQVQRVAERFAFIGAAGEIGIRLQILPWDPGSSVKAASVLFNVWLERRGGIEPAEVRAMIAQVRGFIERYGGSRFDPIVADPDERPVSDRLGWRAGTGESREWLIPPEIWKARFCEGYDPTIVARVLANQGMLKRGERQYARVEWIEGRSQRVYALTARIASECENASGETYENSSKTSKTSKTPENIDVFDEEDLGGLPVRTSKDAGALLVLTGEDTVGSNAKTSVKSKTLLPLLPLTGAFEGLPNSEQNDASSEAIADDEMLAQAEPEEAADPAGQAVAAVARLNGGTTNGGRGQKPVEPALNGADRTTFDHMPDLPEFLDRRDEVAPAVSFSEAEEPREAHRLGSDGQQTAWNTPAVVEVTDRAEVSRINEETGPDPHEDWNAYLQWLMRVADPAKVFAMWKATWRQRDLSPIEWDAANAAARLTKRARQ